MELANSPARRRSWLRGALACLFASLFAACAAHAADERPGRQAVRAVGNQRLSISTASGKGSLALFASRDLASDVGSSDIERAVIVIHGVLRNADVYYRSAENALHAVPAVEAHTLLIAPQFLDERDVAAHRLPADTLRWKGQAWEGGESAAGPAPIGSYEALDALLAMLADRRRFPKLMHVVIAGHSGGGQVVQRYAVVGEGDSKLGGVSLRYVVANPSSYLYFDPERPLADGTFAVPDVAACRAYDRWKYGWGDAPPYARRLTPQQYESRYVERDVAYLLGGADIDPQHPALDTSCAGELQGAFRLARGQRYFEHLRGRHPALAQSLRVVPGVGHDGKRMLGSACGLAALFDDARSRDECK